MLAKGLIAAVLGILFIAYSSTYIVNQRQKALLFQLGEIIDMDVSPGLHLKLPFLNSVRKFDSRILTLNARPESFLTVEKKNVTVDFFVKWRIADIAQYYRATRGDERNALNRLSQIMKDGLRNEFGKRTIQQAVSGERSEIMNVLKFKSNILAKELGIEVKDVRISRIDLPDAVSDAVYARMRAERNRVAREFRARGLEEAEKIRANADRERTEILADAYRDSQITKGEGDAKATALYANAYERDPDFFSFSRTMNAYKNVFTEGDTLVLEPNSEFFDYFGNEERSPPPN